MTTTLTLWTADAAGQARPLEAGRVPADLPVLMIAAPTGTAPSARLELVSGDLRREPLRIGQQPGPVVWLVDTTTLRAARRWTAVLTDDDDDTLGTLELTVDGAGPPRVVDLRVVDLRVVAFLRDGTQAPAADAPASEIGLLLVTAELSHLPATQLTVRLEEPEGRSRTMPAHAVGDVPRVAAPISAPFTEGDLTVSLLHDRTLLRRVRLRLAPTPLAVRAATLLALGPAGARSVGPVLSAEDARGRLVLTYSLAGLEVNGLAHATLELTDAGGAALGAWNLMVDRGSAASLERVWFPLPPGLLAGARSPVTARLTFADDPLEHVQRLQVTPQAPVATFRSDGLVLSAPTEAAPPPPGFGAAGGFFGLVARRVRRRKKRVEPTPPPTEEDDLPF